jgi:hypothetical protein
MLVSTCVRKEINQSSLPGHAASLVITTQHCCSLLHDCRYAVLFQRRLVASGCDAARMAAQIRFGRTPPSLEEATEFSQGHTMCPWNAAPPRTDRDASSGTPA